MADGCYCHTRPSTAEEVRTRLDARRARMCSAEAYEEALAVSGRLSRYDYEVAVCAFLDCCREDQLDPYAVLREMRRG